METIKKYTLENVDWAAVVNIFKEVEWNSREPDEIRSAFSESNHAIFIYAGGELVGFGRTIDDGQYYGMLVDVVVRPSHQNLGLGREIVLYLKNQLAGFKSITLTAAIGKEEFYIKLGWQRQKNTFSWENC